ncbi:MAG: hypothetical protein Q8P89_03490 [bacterium]|nr:hypothetical protein [bacterium]
MKRFFIFLLALLTLAGQPRLTAAAENSNPNNKFGIHLALPSEEDLKDAADLVNSTGGRWGYVTLVMQENDRDRGKWQNVFDQMRRLHMTPIIRLATFMEGNSWRRPDPGDAKEWADFLDSLNWVIKNRYIVLFNEPNRADEWGGTVDPLSYREVAFEFAQKLKEKNPDFFVMMAGFDAAAPHKLPAYEDEELFLRSILISPGDKGKEIFNYLDGWASHSYPNHGFVGSPQALGRNSVQTYLWELGLLRFLGVKKDLPVFITETGWPHAEGKDYQRGLYSQDEVAANFRLYFNRLLNDPKIVAITPFVLNYPDEPFDHFSWRKGGGEKDFYPQYQTVRDLAKIKGEPVQDEKLKVLSVLTSKLITDSTYQIPVAVKNEGQAIWDLKDGYQLNLSSSAGEVFAHFFSDFSDLSPLGQQTLWLYFKTGDRLGNFVFDLVVTKDGKPVSNDHRWSLEIVPAVDIEFKVNLYPKKVINESDFKLLIYNQKEEVVFEKTDIEVKNGVGKIEKVANLVIGEKYRMVALRPYYLPRQGFLTLGEKENKVAFERMLPFDFDEDGKFSLGDIWVLITHPKLFSLFWPW